MLDRWAQWADQQEDLCHHARQMCYGPRLTTEVYDRAVIDGIAFSSMQTEGKKRSRDSVVMMKDDETYWAGRVRYFLNHTPPGMDVSDESGVSVAHVHWYGHVTEQDAMCPALDCPVFTKQFKDDKSGNMWPMELLAPCKLSIVPHRHHSDRIVVLSRFASFLKTVP